MEDIFKNEGTSRSESNSTENLIWKGLKWNSIGLTNHKALQCAKRIEFKIFRMIQQLVHLTFKYIELGRKYNWSHFAACFLFYNFSKYHYDIKPRFDSTYISRKVVRLFFKGSNQLPFNEALKFGQIGSGKSGQVLCQSFNLIHWCQLIEWVNKLQKVVFQRFLFNIYKKKIDLKMNWNGQ